MFNRKPGLSRGERLLRLGFFNLCIMKIERKVLKESPNVNKMKISLRSKGLYYSMLRSNSVYDIFMTDCKKSFYKAVNELIKAGLVSRKQYRDNIGKFGNMIYIVNL